MIKQHLRNGDVLIFKNGEEREYQNIGNIHAVLNAFYDDNLVCKTNDDFTVVEVKRPTYTIIYRREDVNIKKRTNKQFAKK